MGNINSKPTKTDEVFDSGVIYKIYNKDWCYIGSSVNFKARERNHKSDCYNENCPEYNYLIYRTIRANGGMDAFKLEVIHTVTEWVTRRQLSKIEQGFINGLNPNLNKNKACLTKEERLDSMKQYNIDNKERIQEQLKQWREANKDKIKQYYIDNKDKISEYNRLYRLKKKQEANALSVNILR